MRREMPISTDKRTCRAACIMLQVPALRLSLRNTVDDFAKLDDGCSSLRASLRFEAALLLAVAHENVLHRPLTHPRAPRVGDILVARLWRAVAVSSASGCGRPDTTEISDPRAGCLILNALPVMHPRPNCIVRISGGWSAAQRLGR
ncbi:hypothetical protein FB451DRAFT_1408603 [Mycena latifolia]|nr:hypothetical protein FB451DRAFT_1408603 [Mycena latifolia]